MAILMNGKEVAQSLRRDLAKEVSNLRERGVEVTLAVVLVGSDPASEVYVRNKHKACLEAGIRSLQITLPEATTEERLLSEVEKLNADPKINGILVQLPLPKHIDEKKITEAILPIKDVDAFHPENVGRITLGTPRFLPCTPAGIMDLLAFYGVNAEGRRCVVVGRSNIVGKPISSLLLAANGTVTTCHSRTKDLPSVTREADILVVAVGKPKMLTADMVKPGAVVIDVGIHRGEDGKLCGDVDFASVEPIASYITPVPGGVGPMTIAELLANTLRAAKYQNNL